MKARQNITKSHTESHTTRSSSEDDIQYITNKIAKDDSKITDVRNESLNDSPIF
jgi:hypothetical protein